MTPVRRDFSGPWALAEALADAVATVLREGVKARGGATLVVSGGTTPRRFLEALARQPLAWRDIDVTLADERWVPPDHARSNERLLRETLLRGEAAAAKLLPLYTPRAPDPESALVEIAANLAKLPPTFDAVVLGMGMDGHCASLFPHGDHLGEALRVDGAAHVLPMRAPAAEEARMTLTLPALVNTRAMYLHIEGAQKHDVLATALAHTPPFEQAPVASVLEHSAATPEIFYCP